MAKIFMKDFDNPALHALLATFRQELMLLQVLIRRHPREFELRHVDDREAQPSVHAFVLLRLGVVKLALTSEIVVGFEVLLRALRALGKAAGCGRHSQLEDESSLSPKARRIRSRGMAIWKPGSVSLTIDVEVGRQQSIVLN